MKLARLLSLAVLLAAPPALAEKTENSPPDNGFLFEARLGVGSTSFFGAITGGGGVDAIPSILVGARLVGRLHVGLGFAFLRLQNTGGVFGGANATNSVTFAPTVAFDVYKTHDERVMFYLKAGLPLGPVITCPGGGGSCDDNFSIGFDIGAGARYALHHNFSLGLEAGVGASFIGPQRNNTTGIVDVYGALVGSFMTGR